MLPRVAEADCPREPILLPQMILQETMAIMVLVSPTGLDMSRLEGLVEMVVATQIGVY